MGNGPGLAAAVTFSVAIVGIAVGQLAAGLTATGTLGGLAAGLSGIFVRNAPGLTTAVTTGIAAIRISMPIFTPNLI